MCFEIDDKAPIPTKRKFVYKVFAIDNCDGTLVSQYRNKRTDGKCYTFGEKRDIRNESSAPPKTYYPSLSRYQSEAGLYVLFDLKGGLKELRHANNEDNEVFVLVKCAVDPGDYIHSSAKEYDNKPGRAATYYALTPIKVIKVKLNGRSRSSVPYKAVKALKAFKLPKVTK